MDLEPIEPWQGNLGVTHLAVPDSGEYWLSDVPAGMAVFWWRNRPVAHQFVERGGAQQSIGRIERSVLARIGAEEVAASPPLHSVSVVICTRDRPEELARCLASLPQQTYPPREIIVVDNASRDLRTREVVRNAHAVYVREDRPGLDIARNTGAQRA